MIFVFHKNLGNVEGESNPLSLPSHSNFSSLGEAEKEFALSRC